MSDDPQDTAEQLDDDVISGDDAAPGEQSDVFDPPDRTHGIQFADADVTDESFAQRTAQEEPDVVVGDLDEP